MAESINGRFTWTEIVEKILEKNGETNNDDFRKWLLSKEFIGYHMDHYLWQHAYLIHKKINNEDNDHFSIVSGGEGSGKTVLALLYCAAISPSFSMNHVCFSVEDFLAIIKKAKKGDSILLDEGAMFLFSREIMTKTNRKVVKSMNLLRQLNLHICTCIPNFYNLDPYIRKHRVDSLLYIRESKRTYRGITKNGIRIINEVESTVKNIMGVKMPYGNFWDGYWTLSYPKINDITEEAYRKKKRNHLDAFLNEISTDIQSEDVDVAPFVDVGEFIKLVPMNRDVVIANISNKKIPGAKIGGRWYVNGQYYREIRGLKSNLGQINTTKDETNAEHTPPQ